MMANKTKIETEILKALQGYLAGEAQADAELDDLLIPDPDTQETVALLRMIAQGRKEVEDGKTILIKEVFDEMRRLQKKNQLNGDSIKELIEHGRK